MSTSTLMTAEQLFALSPRLPRVELVEGELREMSPSGAEHVVIAARLIGRLAAVVYAGQLGEIFGCEGGFLIEQDPDTVLAPDGAFVTAERIAQTGVPQGYYPGPPDLVIEVVSPNDRARDTARKAERWLNAGVRLVWVINPRSQSATIFRPGVDPITISAEQDLTGEDVVPGFRCRLGDVLV